MVRVLLLQTQLERCQLVKAPAAGKLAQVKQLWPWPDYSVPVLSDLFWLHSGLLCWAI